MQTSHLGRVEYLPTYAAMQAFNEQRNLCLLYTSDAADE